MTKDDNRTRALQMVQQHLDGEYYFDADDIEVMKTIRNALAQPASEAVDLEELKITRDVGDDEKQRGHKMGWNDCIDHLAAAGHLRQPMKQDDAYVTVRVDEMTEMLSLFTDMDKALRAMQSEAKYRNCGLKITDDVLTKYDLRKNKGAI